MPLPSVGADLATINFAFALHYISSAALPWVSLTLYPATHEARPGQQTE
jgi:hypothetical protein